MFIKPVSNLGPPLQMFASAGTFEWWPGRCCLRSIGLCGLATVFFLAATQPGLLKRRFQSEPGEAPTWDSRLLRVYPDYRRRVRFRLLPWIW